MASGTLCPVWSPPGQIYLQTGEFGSGLLKQLEAGAHDARGEAEGAGLAGTAEERANSLTASSPNGLLQRHNQTLLRAEE